MRCPNCNTEIIEGIFCPECGTKVGATPLEEAEIAKKKLSRKNVLPKKQKLRNMRKQKRLERRKSKKRPHSPRELLTISGYCHMDSHNLGCARCWHIYRSDHFHSGSGFGCQRVEIKFKKTFNHWNCVECSALDCNSCFRNILWPFEQLIYINGEKL